MRLDLLHVLRHQGHRLGVGDRAPLQEVAVVDRALEGVRQRQERQHHELPVEAEHREAGADVRGDVPVGEHHPLGRARGAAGIDEGREVVRLHGAGARLELRGVGAGPLLDQLVEGDHPGVARRPLDEHEVADVRQLVDVGEEPFQVGGGLGDHHLGAAVARDIGRLVRQQRGVDRHQHGPRAERREVDRRPVRAVLRHQGHPVAVLDPELQERLRQPPDAVHQLRGGDRLVGAADLGHEAIRLVVACRLQEQLG